MRNETESVQHSFQLRPWLKDSYRQRYARYRLPSEYTSEHLCDNFRKETFLPIKYILVNAFIATFGREGNSVQNILHFQVSSLADFLMFQVDGRRCCFFLLFDLTAHHEAKLSMRPHIRKNELIFTLLVGNRLNTPNELSLVIRALRRAWC